MKLKIYQIDAFAGKQFEGNPAAVVPLSKWLPYKTLQAIAEENNLAETAFFVPKTISFHIRWFTPVREVNLCGHATLASAHVLFNNLGYDKNTLTFESLSGPLTVSRHKQLLTMNFPAQPPSACTTPDLLIKGLGKPPVDCQYCEDYLAVFEKEEDVANIIPDHELLKQLDHRGVIATAPSSSTEYDFVVRFFAPKFGINEDSVTGSAFTQLIPYWSDKLGKTKLLGRQISSRGGSVFGDLQQDRVLLTGTSVQYMEGLIDIPV